ncbi:MAG: hypothetical protein NVSMB49_21310 [Ktedonobacteraceae bacterium]
MRLPFIDCADVLKKVQPLPRLPLDSVIQAVGDLLTNSTHSILVTFLVSLVSRDDFEVVRVQKTER